ncbi:hypothetical protein [Nitratifractor sp.]|uniref:hypothetical protein n=1 Tax=Nitratifractor sp. TaxID=2268144 RepID=UPI0025CD6E4B|nr:hypothetical protein [Nitratifractor sp.]
MYDIEALERQWQRYRRKRILRRSAIAFGIFLLLAFPIAYMTYKGTYRGVANPVKLSQTSPKGTEMNRSLLSASHPVLQKSLRPAAPSLATPTPPPKKPKIVITLSDRNAPTSDAGNLSGEEKRIRLEVTDAKSRQVVKEIETRFSNTQDYDDAIYLAKYYYGKHRYKKAEIWAMRANSIDSSQEESWLLYGKAKAKQGHRAAALRILQAYYDQSGSMRAKMIIDRIRRGKRF